MIVHRLALLTIPFALMMAQDKQPAASGQKTSPKAKTTTAAHSAGPVTIPPDAELVAPRVYRHKDADGKVWLYRQTPMGVSRMPDTSGEAEQPGQPARPGTPAASQANMKPAQINASDLGDSVRFEQATPMGKRVWVTKKDELSPKEKAVLEQLKNDAKNDAKQPEK